MSKPQWTKEQQEVIDLRDRNILVAAAAGSGKTAVLVERIIEEITEEKNPKDIDKLLVVTFTKAAAAEMRTRIGNALELRIEENPDNDHIQKQASLLHLAQITTIDSFCQSIIKNYFHTIDFDPVFNVGDKTDMDLMQQEVLAELLEKRYAKAKEENDISFLAFTDIFSPGRTDSGIEDLVLSLFEESRSFPWPMEWLDDILKMYQVTSDKEFENTKWMERFLDYLAKCVEDFLVIAKKALQLCDDVAGPTEYHEAIEADIKYLEELSKAKSYHSFAELFAISKERKMRLKAIRRKDIDVAQKDAVRAYRDIYWSDGIEKIAERFFFQSEEKMREEMLKMAGPVAELVKLTKEFSEAFSAKKREEGLVDFADMEHLALQILVEYKDGKAYPSKTALDLQNYYEEILTDEYQDSNYVQELLLNSLCCEADENMLADNFISYPKKAPYLFMVGDVKQSIYRFRQARPDLFIHKYESYTEGEGPCQKIDLHKNFRSRASVLESANYIFEQIMTKKLGGIVYDDMARLVPGADFGECSKRHAQNTEILLFDESGNAEDALDKKELEAAGIGQKIKELVESQNPMYIRDKEDYRPVRYGDIAILLRSTSGWSEVFVEVLNEMGIPAFADTKTGYFTSLEVKTVLNLLQIIDNPRQDIPLAAVLRSVFCHLTDEELAWIGSISDGIDFWDKVQLFIAYRKWKAGESSLYEEYREKGICLEKLDETLKEQKNAELLYKKLTTFVEKMEEYRVFVQVHSVYELLRKVYSETGYYDYMATMPAGEKRKANLDILLQQSIEFANNGHQGIFGFTRYIENLQKSEVDFGEAAIQDENTNAVRIMTIHKSKGLEFPVVFVAGTGKLINQMDARKSTIIDGDYGVGTDYVDLTMRIKKPTLFKRHMANAIVLETLAEEIRVLYVALTRAKEQLYICGSVKNAGKALEKWMVQSEVQNFLLLKKAQTYLDWIMPAVLKRDGIRNTFGLENVCIAADDLFTIALLTQEDIVQSEVQSLEDDMVFGQKLSEIDTSALYDESIHQALKERLSYRYPYATETELPIKVSVSELKRKGYEEAQKLEEEEETEIPKPAFLQQEKTTSGAARGTLYHMVMEHFPYAQIAADDKEWDAQDFKNYLTYLTKQGYMTEDEMSLLDCRKFVAFMKTDIGKRMAAAGKEKKLRLEQPFMLGIQADEMYTEQSSQELIMVQGIIDAFFFEGDDIILVDYKTDRVKDRDGHILIEKYKEQLAYYAQALERLTGRSVKEKIIYSFTLGKELLVP